MKRIFLLPIFALAACDESAFPAFFVPAPDQVAEPAEVPEPTLDPTPPPPPPPSARTVEQFDTTTAEDRAEALAVEEPAGETSLGTTNVSLGSPADPGIWLKTPLVSDLVQGRVEYPGNGKSVNIELRPSGGASGSGSQMSLAAMRLLEIPLTQLADVQVFQN